MKLRTMILCVCAFSAQAGHAANLDITPSSGPGGFTVTLTASGFDSGNVGYNTGFYVDNGPGLIALCPPESRANCDVEMPLPAYTPGPHTFTARNSANESASDTFTVAEPSLRISPTCGPPGTEVTVTGREFPIPFDAGIYFDSSPVVSGNYPDDSGNFTVTFEIPAASDGPHTINAHNSAGTDESWEFSVPDCADIGQVTDITGTLEVQQPDGSWTPLAPGDHLLKNQKIRTGANSRAKLLFADGTEFSMLSGPNGDELRLDHYVYSPQTNQGSSLFSMLQGVLVYTSGLMGTDPGENNKQLDVGCGLNEAVTCGSIGIRGTSFITRSNEATQNQELYLTHGTVTITPYGTGLTTSYDAPITIVFNASTITTSPLVDTDGDDVPDGGDDCKLVADADQYDADADGYGNLCDADLNESGRTTTADYTILRNALNSSNPIADLNHSGLVTTADYTILRNRLNTAPGPSGLAP